MYIYFIFSDIYFMQKTWETKEKKTNFLTQYNHYCYFDLSLIYTETHICAPLYL